MKRTRSFFLILIFILFIIGLFRFDIMAAKDNSPGVYLYTKPNYLGHKYFIDRNASMLPGAYRYRFSTQHQIDNAVSSIRLVGVSSIAVFVDSDFRGNCATITKNTPNLNRTSVGNNSISSVKLNSRCAPAVPSITLYDQKDFKGRGLTISSNTADLGYANFRNKTASFKLNNIRRIAVFSKTGYLGKCQSFDKDYRSLAGTDIGLNSISSIKLNVMCAPVGPIVTLYDKKNFQGNSFIINENVPDLGSKRFNNKTASIKLTNIRSIAVFNKTHYQGKCMTINRDTFSLAGTAIGVNSISSIKINTECADEKMLTIKNRSGLLIQTLFPSGIRNFFGDVGSKGKKEIASGQKKTFYIKAETNVILQIRALQPIGDLAPIPEWHKVCEYHLFMGNNYTITVKGSFFKAMNCQKEMDR